MKEKYVTVTGFPFYEGIYPFKIGSLIRCTKEPDNRYDSEAIKCTLPGIGTVGYIANSTKTVANGTMSAGRVYDRVCSKFYIRVLFTTETKVICRVEDEREPNELRLELLSQLEDDWNDEEGDDDLVPAFVSTEDTDDDCDDDDDEDDVAAE